jgi:uncharacterized membrane protein
MSFFLAAWISLNVIAWARHWDPYPFILFNLALSFQAAYSASVIMMSQSRQEAKDRLRTEQDYETNLKAELEIEKIHEKIEELLDAHKRQAAFLQRLAPSGDASNVILRRRLQAAPDGVFRLAPGPPPNQ